MTPSLYTLNQLFEGLKFFQKFLPFSIVVSNQEWVMMARAYGILGCVEGQEGQGIYTPMIVT